MGRKKKEGTVIVSVRMPTYIHEYFKKQAAKKDTTVNAVIVAYLEAATCALDKERILNSYKEWLEEEYKRKLQEKIDKRLEERLNL